MASKKENLSDIKARFQESATILSIVHFDVFENRCEKINSNSEYIDRFINREQFFKMKLFGLAQTNFAFLGIVSNQSEQKFNWKILLVSLSYGSSSVSQSMFLMQAISLANSFAECTDSISITAATISVAMSEDIKLNLNSIKRNTKTRRNQSAAIKQLPRFVQIHTLSKQLSENFKV